MDGNYSQLDEVAELCSMLDAEFGLSGSLISDTESNGMIYDYSTSGYIDEFNVTYNYNSSEPSYEENDKHYETIAGLTFAISRVSCTSQFLPSESFRRSVKNLQIQIRQIR